MIAFCKTHAQPMDSAYRGGPSTESTVLKDWKASRNLNEQYRGKKKRGIVEVNLKRPRWDRVRAYPAAAA